MAFSELIALYLFLGGASAGAFAVMSVLDLRKSLAAFRLVQSGGVSKGGSPHASSCGRRRGDAVFHLAATRVYGASFAVMLAGLMCLLADLGKPDLFYLLFLYPTSSYMSIGSFALALLAACMAVVLAESSLELGGGWKKAAIVAKVTGVAFSVVVMVYTGLLLKTVISVSLWQSWWLPVLFLFSALSCGCALCVLAALSASGDGGAHGLTSRLAVADAAFIVLEAASAAAYAASVSVLSAPGTFDVLLFGEQAGLFCGGFIACGIAAPLLVDATALIMRRGHSDAVIGVVAALVLVGGACLRFALVGAGIQTAI